MSITAWSALPRAARVYAGTVIAAGTALIAGSFPTVFPNPVLFISLLAFACLTSAWKVTLPLSLTSGSTLSVSYAADLMALLLLGPHQAMLIAVAGAWTQCTFRVRQRYPAYRTIFSMAAEAITIQATGLAYFALGGGLDLLQVATLPKALVGAIAAYFFVNTLLVAGAIALSTRQPVGKVWHHNFLWSAPCFMVAGLAGAIAAVVIAAGHHWAAILLLAPIYLTYQSYRIFLGRIEDERRHVEETERLHREAVEALRHARRAERALADEKERLAVTLRSVGDGVITTDLNGKVLLVNNAAETLTGWSSEDACGRPLDDVLHNFDPETGLRCDNSIDKLTRDAPSRGISRSTSLLARDGTRHPVEEVAAPLRNAAGTMIGMVVALRDLSDALKAQEERVKASKLASLGLLAGGIAHDFNNILMSIVGNVSLARSTVASGPAARALDEAQQAGVRARQLTWQLLTFSRGGVPVKRTIAVADLLKESASLVLRGSNVSCAFDIAPDLWAVSADESQLVQVFTNVIINAQQAIPEAGSILIRAENAVERADRWEHGLSAQAGRYVSISVTDDGIGIPLEHQPRIFDPYFTTKQKGTGLGLAASHSIVKNHGGSISVDSKRGQGTTIRINLPAASGAGAPLEIAPPAAAGTGRILVMDDEASVRTLAVKMIRHLGHDVEVVRDGHAAIERYRRALKNGQRFDAVILDLVVPGGMGAREVIDRLREIDPAVNAIVVSGYAEDPALTEFRDYGFKASIAKPYTLSELDLTLHSVMPAGTWRVH